MCVCVCVCVCAVWFNGDKRRDHFNFLIIIIQDEEYKGKIRIYRDNAAVLT
jgi:hypothetical protein